VSDSVQHHALEFLEDDHALVLEESLWWVQGRKGLIRQYLSLCNPGSPKLNILDVGCGSGGNLAVLSEFGTVWGLEPSSILAKRARDRNVASEVYEADLASACSQQRFDLFTLFDVLEHIEDDRAFLRELAAVSPTNHNILISVPAHPFLYGEHDRLLHHHRRYTKAMLAGALESEGYSVRFISHQMTLLFPAALAARSMDQLLACFGCHRQKVDVGNYGKPLAFLLERLLRLEALAIPQVSLPFGVWLFCVASRGKRM